MDFFRKLYVLAFSRLQARRNARHIGDMLSLAVLGLERLISSYRLQPLVKPGHHILICTGWKFTITGYFVAAV